MYYVAKKMVGNHNEVIDIVQEVFISFFKKLQSENKIHNPKSWLLALFLQYSRFQSPHKNY